MTPELAAAFLMFAGLAQTPTIADCAQTFEKFDRTVDKATTIRVVFSQTSISALDSRKEARNGLFTMRRDGDDCRWRIDYSLVSDPERKEILAWVDNSLWLFESRTKCVAKLPMKPQDKADFNKKTVNPAYPLNDLVALRKKYRSTIVKIDGNYEYVRLDPLTGSLAEPMRVVFTHKALDNYPAQMLRQFERLEPNGDVVRVSISNWTIDHADDLKSLKIEPPPVPEGGSFTEGYSGWMKWLLGG